jgi:hypothetical protein
MAQGIQMKKVLKALTLATLFHLSLDHHHHVHLHDEHEGGPKVIYTNVAR